MGLLLICFFGIYVIKWTYEFYTWIRKKIRTFGEVNEASSVDIPNIQTIELPLPTYEEAIRQNSNINTRRRRRRPRNHSQSNVASDNPNNNEIEDNDAQIDGESTGDSNNGESGNENGNSAREPENDGYMVTLNFGANNEVKFGSYNVNSNETNAADESSVQPGSSNDIVDKHDNTSVSSRYDTASCSSAGGGDSRAPSPWSDF